MRMSSEMFPFASHPEYGYTLEYAQEELTAAGHLAKKYGHRLTTCVLHVCSEEATADFRGGGLSF